MAAACPPSTGTTEYVALLTSGSSGTDFFDRKGRDDPKQKSEEATKRDEVERLRRMMRRHGPITKKCDAFV